MSKTTIIILVILVLLVLGISGYFLLKPTKTESLLGYTQTGSVDSGSGGLFGFLGSTVTSALNPEVVGAASSGITTGLTGGSGAAVGALLG